MKLFAWAIIAFRDTEDGVSFGQHLFYSMAPSERSLQILINAKQRELFPSDDGWHSHSQSVQEIEPEVVERWQEQANRLNPVPADGNDSQ